MLIYELCIYIYYIKVCLFFVLNKINVLCYFYFYLFRYVSFCLNGLGFDDAYVHHMDNKITIINNNFNSSNNKKLAIITKSV